jgi:hypothetical protein
MCFSARVQRWSSLVFGGKTILREVKCCSGENMDGGGGSKLLSVVAAAFS